MNKLGKLHLIPTYLSDGADHTIPQQVKQQLPFIHHFLAENIRTARRYLSSLKIYEAIESLQFEVLDKNTEEQSIPKLLQPIFNGIDMGILSEAGCPGVADPGALIVNYAHRHQITVIPYVGPSSLLMALMASGLNGQKFAFHGYLPIEAKEAANAIKAFERESREKKQTQLFIETPYRNNSLLKNFINSLHAETLLCIAIDLTGKDEFIRTLPVKEWRSKQADLPKLPAVFLFLA
jgi:16S rRNA (cytidine1402-2'-O)-methyltransferase